MLVNILDNTPIEFANIYTQGKEKGVSSNKNGELILNNFGAKPGDTIGISHVSFLPIKVAYEDIFEMDTIFLEPLSKIYPKLSLDQNLK